MGAANLLPSQLLISRQTGQVPGSLSSGFHFDDYRVGQELSQFADFSLSYGDARRGIPVVPRRTSLKGKAGRPTRIAILIPRLETLL